MTPPSSDAYIVVSPTDAYNMFIAESVVLLDCCELAPILCLPGSVSVDQTLPASAAAAKAHGTVMEQYTPDNPTIALLMIDDSPSSTAPPSASVPAAEVASWLLTTGRCKRVYATSRAAYTSLYAFTMVGYESMPPIPPAVVIPGKLLLGSRGSVNAKVLDAMKVTHVVSVLDFAMASNLSPHGREHLRLQIADTHNANLAPVMRSALPYIQRAIDAKGCVLVHCEQGVSRSASVVAAFLMRARGIGRDAALAEVCKKRPRARPNAGFMKQLLHAEWDRETAIP